MELTGMTWLNEQAANHDGFKSWEQQSATFKFTVALVFSRASV